MIDGEVTAEAVAQVKSWLEEPTRATATLAHNFALGAQHYSFEALAQILARVIPAGSTS